MLRQLILVGALVSAVFVVPASASADPVCTRAGYHVKESTVLFNHLTTAYYLNCSDKAVVGRVIATGPDGAFRRCVKAKEDAVLGSASPTKFDHVTDFRVEQVLDGSYCSYNQVTGY